MTELKASTKTAENPMITVEGFKLKKLSVITTFSDEAKIDKAVEKFRTEALSVVPDLSTKKGRDSIASVAYKISKKKTSIVSQMIEPSIEDAKAIVSSVGKGKKYFQSKMDDLRDEVRDPLNKWEEEEKLKEEKRIAEIKDNIEGIYAIATFDHNNPPGKDEITSLIEAADSINCEEGFAEFTQDALQAKSKTKETLAEMLNKIIQKEIADKAAEELELKEAEIEKQRLKQVAQERLNKLMMIPTTMFGKTSKEIQAKIDSIQKFEIKESEFGEFTQQASDSVVTVVQQLGAMLAQVKFMEEQQPAKQEPEITHTDNTAPVETYQEPVKEEQPIKQTKVRGGYTTKIELTPHEAMLKEVSFWCDEYHVINSQHQDLFRILNKYK